jgi:hypothetical protein
MSKKKTTKRKQPPATSQRSETNFPALRPTAGAVTGAVLGSVVAGPVGALAGGAVGALVGDSSAKGKKPIRRAVNAIREEFTSGRAKAALKSVGKRITSLRKSKKKKKAAPAVKKKKPAKTGAKSAKASKGAATRPKKRAKKKS